MIFKKAIETESYLHKNDHQRIVSNGLIVFRHYILFKYFDIERAYMDILNNHKYFIQFIYSTIMLAYDGDVDQKAVSIISNIAKVLMAKSTNNRKVTDCSKLTLCKQVSSENMAEINKFLHDYSVSASVYKILHVSIDEKVCTVNNFLKIDNQLRHYVFTYPAEESVIENMIRKINPLVLDLDVFAKYFYNK